MMRIFIAGIMQGSHRDNAVHDQDYRTRLQSLIFEHISDAEIYDPWALHSDSAIYTDEMAQATFRHHLGLCGQYDAVIAFIPQASMGTAIEIWEAYRHGKAVIAITPLVHNWAVKFCSHALFPDEISFEAALREGDIKKIIESSRSSGTSA